MKMSTERDKAILNTILNPFLPGAFDVYEDSADLDDDGIGAATSDVLDAKALEKKAVEMAESGMIQEAIVHLSKAIETAPHLPSLYNNRAQAHRLNDDTTSALDDLNIAISLSKGSGRSSRQAFCQRGLIRKKNGQNDKAMEDFRNAARLGSPFAKMVLVQSNPYAALCNEMLSQILDKLVTGHSINPSIKNSLP